MTEHHGTAAQTAVRPCSTGCGRLTWYEDRQLCGVCGRTDVKVCDETDCTRVARQDGRCWKHGNDQPRGRICNASGCKRAHHASGLCTMHYRRARRARSR